MRPACIGDFPSREGIDIALHLIVVAGDGAERREQSSALQGDLSLVLMQVEGAALRTPRDR